MSYQEIAQCGACLSQTLELVHDFGNVPLAGYFPRLDELEEEMLPMKLLKCSKCELFQISPDVDQEALFKDYRYVSSVGMQPHFSRFSQWFIEFFRPSKDAKIVEFGCNDGPLLQSLKQDGFSAIGVDPATNIVELAKKKGLRVINDYFNQESLEKYQELQNVDYLFSSNSFAHISRIHEIASTVAKSLSETGIFIVEVQSFHDLIQHNAIDFIYHEHKYYYSLISIESLMKLFDLHLIHGEKIDVHGGSYRLVFSKQAKTKSLKLQELEQNERINAITTSSVNDAIKLYKKEMAKTKLYLQSLTSRGGQVVAFGASGRGNMILGELKIGVETVKYVIDESPERIGRVMAQSGIPIRSLSSINEMPDTEILILAWNYKFQILKKWPFRKNRFIVPLPEFELIERNQ
jgi:hypothetical protein